MRAWILEDIGSLELREAMRPEPGDGEVLVRVQAAGICGSDLPRIYEAGAHRMPLVPGHEFAGVVVSAGSAVGQRWVGKRVGVFPLIPCRSCMCCRDEKYEMCSSYSYLGSRQDGGFAEYAAVPEWNLIELPDGVSFEQAAMLEPLSVAVHAMRRMHTDEEETVVVYGLGTIGMLLAALLHGQGRRNLLVVGNKDIQREKALELGIPEENYFDIRNGESTEPGTEGDDWEAELGKARSGSGAEPDGSRGRLVAEPDGSRSGTVTAPNGGSGGQAAEWCRERTAQRGADVVFECVGKSGTCSDAIRLAAPGGRVCLVGNPMTDMHLEKSVYWKILRQQLQLCGTWNSSFLGEGSSGRETDDWHYALDCLSKGLVCPEKLITHRFTMDGLERGLKLMRDKEEEFIKVMCVIG